MEKKEDWEEHRAGVLESLSPFGHLELMLAEQVALLCWRLHRVVRYETESIALSQEQIEDDLAWERRFDSRVLRFHHPEDVRHDLQHTRRIERLIKGFSKLDGDKGLPGSDAAGILDAVWGRISDVVEAEEVQMPEEVPEWAGLEGDMTE